METKICGQCKYFRDLSYTNLQPATLAYVCVIKVKQDLVTGKLIATPSSRELLSCYEQRAEVSFIEDKCGLEGKHYVKG